MAEDTLVSISEASQMLGVSEASLRQWTDEGKIKAFITPGGHRRYLRAELKKFMGSHPKMLGIRDLALELQETTVLHRQIAQESLKNAAWLDQLNDEEKGHLANLGRQLLNMIIKYITEPSHREEMIQLIRNVGHDHGEMLAKMDLPLIDSVEAFLLHRNPIMNAATHLMRKREAFTGRVVKAIPLVAYVMDEAMVALVAAHQQHRNGIKGRIEGEAAG